MVAVVEQKTVEDLLEAIAAKQPTPGGGAVAALTSALAAALGEMVVRYRLGKAGSNIQPDVLEALTTLRQAATELAAADATAFARLSELWKLSPDDPKRRGEWTHAVQGAIDPPSRVIGTSLEILQQLDQIRDSAGASLRSDLAIAALLAQAGAEAAAWNIRVNLPLLDDDAEAARHESETDDRLRRAGALRDSIEIACRAK